MADNGEADKLFAKLARSEIASVISCTANNVFAVNFYAIVCRDNKISIAALNLDKGGVFKYGNFALDKFNQLLFKKIGVELGAPILGNNSAFDFERKGVAAAVNVLNVKPTCLTEAVLLFDAPLAKKSV